MKTIYTCILGPYEKLKEPKVITPGWEYVCYTDQVFESKIWKIFQIGPVDNSRLTARMIKALFYNYVYTYCSIYIDGSFEINCDLNKFWNKYSILPFSAPKHPQRDCVFLEVEEIIKCKRGGREGIEAQIESYRGTIPEHNGIITSGILLRQKTPFCMDLCAAWFEETSKWSLRDQVSFAKVSLGKPIHTFLYRYNAEDSFIYHPHKEKNIDGTVVI